MFVATKVITIVLLHPQNSTAIQKWTFKDESVIRIGRSTDNNVVLYSAVVSRHHLELRQINNKWEVISLGANGTYLNERVMTEPLPIIDGAILRLAKSGPKLQVRFGEVLPPE